MVLSCDGLYVVKGRVELLSTMVRLNQIYGQFKRKGLGMLATGETSCFFKRNLVRDLMRYEYALHRILSTPMDAICAFDLQTIVDTGYSDVIMSFIRAHRHAFFTGPRGIISLEPENVKDTYIEELLDIEI